MFMKIKTNNADSIVIGVPTDVAAESLPQLIAMFENNAVFVRKLWGAPYEVIEPSIEIILGDKVVSSDSEHTLAVTSHNAVLDNNFSIYQPSLRADYSKALDKKEKENAKLRAEVNYLTNEIASLKESLQNLQNNCCSKQSTEPKGNFT